MIIISVSILVFVHDITVVAIFLKVEREKIPFVSDSSLKRIKFGDEKA